jgi:hypothetical protein
MMQRLAVKFGKPFGSTYLHGSALETFVESHWEKVPGLTLIKAHEMGPKAIAALQAGLAPGVCTFRDPRDCVASDLVFMGRGMDHTLKRMNASLECLRIAESVDRILFVRYEDMMINRQNEIRRIARHLGLPSDISIVSQVDAKTNLQSSRQLCQQIKNRPSTQVVEIDSHRVDLRTHLHENHIDNARIGRWKDELSADQGRYLSELFAPWLLKWGYETQASLKQLMVGSSSYWEVPASTDRLIAPTPNSATPLSAAN